MTDIIVIGAGVTGCAVARELARYVAKKQQHLAKKRKPSAK